MRCRIAVVAVCLILLNTPVGFPSGAPSPEDQIEMHWSELSAALAGGRVTLMLPDGTVLQGETVEVKQEELVLKVSKTSDKRAYPKGRRSIPRGLVSTVSLTKTEGIQGRIIGTVAGFVAAGALLGAARIGNLENEVSGWVAVPLLGVAVGGPMAGYYVGRSLDRKTTVIKVLPD